MNIKNSLFQNKPLLIIVAVLLVLVELQIFFVFASKSGKKNTLQVMNDSGTVIYEADGEHLTKFKKYYFESTFGPFENYEKKLVTRTEPFPFRAWFATAIGLPLGFTLLLAFIISAFSTLLGKKQNAPQPAEDNETSADPKGKMDLFLTQISRMNIFVLGACVFLIVLAFWILPNLISFIGQTGLEIIERYGWFIATAVLAVLLIFAWFLYLRYLLAKKTLEAETHIREYQLSLSKLPGPEASIREIENKSDPEDPDVLEVPESNN
jgi:flagellar basal body-associated protein FliL